MQGLEIAQSEQPTPLKKHLVWRYESSKINNLVKKKRKVKRLSSKKQNRVLIGRRLRDRRTHYEVEQNVSWSSNHSTETAQPTQRVTAGTARNGALRPPEGSASPAQKRQHARRART